MHDESIILQTWRTEDIANTRDVYTTCIYVSANANQIKLLRFIGFEDFIPGSKEIF